MLYHFIILVTSFVLILASVFIVRMLAFTRSRRSWIIMNFAVLLMASAQILELVNLYFFNNNEVILNIYFILNLIIAILITIAIVQIGTILKRLKQSEKERAESENRFKLLFDNSSDEIFLADFDGYFIEVNQEVLKRLGYTREELMKKNFVDIKTPDYAPLVQKNIEIILKNGQHVYETEHLTKDGKIVFLEMNSRVIDYFGRKAILSIARDITERKEMERKIAAAIIETEERERKRFAADLHDGLAPLLSTIKLYTDMLKKSKFNKISYDEAIGAVDELVDKAIITTREISNNIMPSILLDFGLPAAIKNFCNYINNTNSIEIHLDTSQYKLTGHRIEETVIFQCVKELVHNTLKHAQAKHIEIFLESHDNKINLFYKDNGKGFNVEEKLNHPTGFGLSNIANKVKTINGLFLLKSKENEGMSVLITIQVKS